MIAPEELEPLERFEVHDLDSAEWAMTKLAQKQKALAELVEQHATWVRRYDEWLKNESGPLERDIAYFEGLLTEYARQRREADPKMKSTKLPSGTITSRTQRPALDITDEAALVAFLRNVAAELGKPVEDFLAVKVSVKKDAVKSLLAPAGLENGVAVLSDGEPVPGVEVKGGGVGFTVKPGGGE